MTTAPRRHGGMTLAEVLRRAHRHELSVVARSLGMPRPDRPRDQLALAIERTLRAAGSNDLWNILLRRGRAPTWDAILYEEARRLGIPTEQDDGELERALVLRAPPPAQRGLLAVVVPVLLVPLRLVLLMFGPIAWLIMVGWFGRPRRAVLAAGLRDVVALREKVENRFIIALIGPPSVGKDAALAAVFGVDTGNVDPVAGATREAAVYTVAGHPGVELLNTPGLGDVDTRLTAETRSLLDQADLFLFLISAQTGVRTRERDEYVRARHRGRPVLVLVNKIDTLRHADRVRMLQDTREKLGLSSDRVLGVALDPLPQLAPGPVGVSAVQQWVAQSMVAAGRRPLWPVGDTHGTSEE